MKNLTLLLITFCISCYTINAATITVSNNPNSPGQYTDLQTAINAAASGDVILVAGSNTSYGNAIINDKSLHLKGVGYSPDKQIPFDVNISMVTLGSINSNINSYGSIIEGFNISLLRVEGPSYSLTATHISNITIRRNNIDGLSIRYFVNGINIYNNVIRYFSKDNDPASYTSNIVFSNNIVWDTFNHEKINSYPTRTGSIVVSNNLFCTTLYSSPNSISDCYNANFHNNIFYNSISYDLGNEMCNFSFNISYGATNNNFNTTGTNGGGNNLINQNPLFISEIDSLYQNTDDFNNPNTSPVHNAGSDGTDIGIYGGAYPWPDGGASGSGFMYSQEPQIPQVNQMNITTTTIPVGGNLTVTAKGIVNH